MRIPKPAMKKARIEIIPMIDAIFFLLVFFMFSSLSMIRMRGANIALPANQSSSGSGTDASTPKLIVSVTGNSAYYINKKRVSSATLQNALQDEVKNNPNAVVVVNMAKTQTTQTLIEVLDSVAKVTTRSGAPVAALIATEPVDAKGRPLEARDR